MDTTRSQPPRSQPPRSQPVPETHTSLAIRAHLWASPEKLEENKPVAARRGRFASAHNYPQEIILFGLIGEIEPGRYAHELQVGGAAVHIFHGAKSASRFTLYIEHASGYTFHLGDSPSTGWGLARVSRAFEGGFPAHRHPGCRIYAVSTSSDPVFATVEVVLSPRALAVDKTRTTVVMYNGAPWLVPEGDQSPPTKMEV